MEKRILGYIVVALIIGSVSGYLISSNPLIQEINLLEEELAQHSQMINDLEADLDELRSAETESNLLIEDLGSTLTELEDIILDLESTLTERNNTIWELEEGLNERSQHIAFLNEVIAELESFVAQRNVQIENLEEIIIELEQTIAGLRTILLTEIQISEIKWNINENMLNVSVENVGNYSTLIELISVRRNTEDSTFSTQEITPPIELNVNETTHISWGGSEENLTLQQGNSYTVRVTCSTGFTFETIISIPAPEEPPKYTQIRITSVTWNLAADTASIRVKNTGTQIATIVQVSAYNDMMGWNNEDVTEAIGASQYHTFVFDFSTKGWDVQEDEEYILRVKCSTGFRAEKLSTTPTLPDNNMVVNSGFETGDLTGWSPSTPTENISVRSGGAYKGNYCLEIGGYTKLSQSLSQSTSSTVVFWAKCSSPSDTSRISIFFWKNGVFYYRQTIGPVGGIWSRFEIDPSLEYDKISFSTYDETYPEPHSYNPEVKLIDNVTIIP